MIQKGSETMKKKWVKPSIIGKLSAVEVISNENHGDWMYWHNDGSPNWSHSTTH